MIRPDHLTEEQFQRVLGQLIPLEHLQRLHLAGTSTEPATELDRELAAAGHFKIDPETGWVVRTSVTQSHYQLQVAMRNELGAQAWRAE